MRTPAFPTSVCMHRGINLRTSMIECPAIGGITSEIDDNETGELHYWTIFPSGKEYKGLWRK